MTRRQQRLLCWGSFCGSCSRCRHIAGHFVAFLAIRARADVILASSSFNSNHQRIGLCWFALRRDRWQHQKLPQFRGLMDKVLERRHWARSWRLQEKQSIHWMNALSLKPGFCGCQSTGRKICPLSKKALSAGWPVIASVDIGTLRTTTPACAPRGRRAPAGYRSC